MSIWDESTVEVGQENIRLHAAVEMVEDKGFCSFVQSLLGERRVS